MTTEILVIGDVIEDVLVRPAGPIRIDTDTAAHIDRRDGGSAANVACWLGELELAVDFVGSVGAADVQRHREGFARYGVIAHLTGTVEPTGCIVVLVQGEERTMLTSPGANLRTGPGAVPEELLTARRHLHLTGYSIFSRSAPHEEWSALIQRAHTAGMTVSVDPASAGFLAEYGQSAFLDTVAGADVLLPNLAEAQLLSGISDAAGAAEALQKRFPVVAVTAGAGGAVVASSGSVIHHPAPRVAGVVDPTGAGDAFTAGFLAGWLRDANPARAARSGVELAARALSILGGRPHRSAATDHL